jgi:hypothetical protein
MKRFSSFITIEEYEELLIGVSIEKARCILLTQNFQKQGFGISKTINFRPFLNMKLTFS